MQVERINKGHKCWRAKKGFMLGLLPTCKQEETKHVGAGSSKIPSYMIRQPLSGIPDQDTASSFLSMILKCHWYMKNDLCFFIKLASSTSLASLPRWRANTMTPFQYYVQPGSFTWRASWHKWVLVKEREQSLERSFRHRPVRPIYAAPREEGMLYAPPIHAKTLFPLYSPQPSLSARFSPLKAPHEDLSFFGAKNSTRTSKCPAIFFSNCAELCACRAILKASSYSVFVIALVTNFFFSKCNFVH